MLYVFVVIEHSTRRLAHINVTTNPNADWTLQQLREVVGNGGVHRYLIHDRDRIFAKHLDDSIKALGVEVLRSPRSGTVDIGFATASDIGSDLATQPVYVDSYLAVLHPDHPLARKRELAWRDLINVPMIAPLRGNPVRTHLDRALAREGYTLPYAHEVSLPWTMMGLVRARLGVAVLTDAVRAVAEWMNLQVRTVQRPVIRRELLINCVPGPRAVAECAALS
jgi:DNA-binding transcriptional LysR family regulator